MTKIILYDDGGDSLYLHKHDADEVYCHIELFVPYGATFQQDAAEVADGIEPDETLERIPYAQFAESAGSGIMRAVAVWEEGKIRKLAQPGPNGMLYLRNPSDFDDNDQPYGYGA